MRKEERISYAKLISFSIKDLDLVPVIIEVSVSFRGLPSFDIVGLPSKEVSESKKRILSAFKNSGLRLKPAKIVVNLSPADIRKSGSFYDLPIAVGIYAAYNCIKLDPKMYFFGELSLSGEVINSGFLLHFFSLFGMNNEKLFIPSDVSVPYKLRFFDIYCVSCLSDLLSYIQGKESTLQRPVYEEVVLAGADFFPKNIALVQLALLGRHSMIIFGSPGIGKSFLLRQAYRYLPHVPLQEELELLKLQLLAAIPNPHIGPVMRAPHSASSYISIFGGGSKMLPGEISVSHKGILLLDEITDFRSDVLQGLRVPLSEKSILVSNSSSSKLLPADFLLLASSNKCYCGFKGNLDRPCICTPSALSKFERKLSFSLLDRFDIKVDLDNYKDLIDPLQPSVFYEIQKFTLTRNLKVNKLYNSELSISDLGSLGLVTSREFNFMKEKTLRMPFRQAKQFITLSVSVADIRKHSKIKMEDLRYALYLMQLS